MLREIDCECGRRRVVDNLHSPDVYCTCGRQILPTASLRHDGDAELNDGGVDAAVINEATFSPLAPPNNQSSWFAKAIVAGVIVVGVVSCIAHVGKEHDGWFSNQPKRLPPREVESAAQRNRAAGEVFGDNGRVAAPANDEELVAFFEDFGNALRERDERALAALVDTNRMYQEMERSGHVARLDYSARGKLIEHFGQAIPKHLAKSAAGYEFDRFTIKKIQPSSADASETIVFVREWSDMHNRSDKCRYWLVCRDERWRLFDIQSLGVPLRLTDGMSLGIQAAQQGDFRAGDMKQQWERIGRLDHAVAIGDTELVRSLLAEGEPKNVAPQFRGLFWYFSACYAVGDERYQDALDDCNRAKRQYEDLPILALIRAAAWNGLTEYSRARDEAQRFLDLLGGDADGYAQLGLALTGLQDTEGAKNAFFKGLADNPDSVENLYHLSTVLHGEELSQLGIFYAGMREPLSNLVILCESLYEAEHLDAFHSLVDKAADLSPEDPRVVYYQHVADERWDDAVIAAPTAFGELPESADPTLFLVSLVDAFFRSGRSLHGLETVPPMEATFVRLATHALGREDTATLTLLIDAFEDERPGNILAPQWRVTVQYLNKNYDGVVATADSQYESLIQQGADAHFLADRLVRSLLHTNRLERATEVANEYWMQTNDPLLRAVVSAASGDVDLTEQWFRYCVDYGYSPAAFHEDEFLASALKSEAFAGVREKFPRVETSLP